jgi:hypothetical protein
MSTADQDAIRLRYRELKKKADELRRELDHVRIDFRHLQLDCSHPDKYATNWCGRDPGGAKCDDCGKVW